MRTRLTALAVVIAAALAASPAAQADGLHATLQPDSTFPQRSLLVTLPNGVSSFGVQVTENGQPVIPHLTSITNSRVPVSIAVLLDTSDSMQGAKLAAAIAASKTLVDQKPDRAEAALFGIAGSPYVIHGWSNNGASFLPALQGVKTTQGTHIWDTVVMASQLLHQRSGTSKVIVLLTDGRDTGSAASLQDAIAAARGSHVRVYAISLPGAGNSTDLQQLVDSTAGQLVQVSDLTTLTKVYADLARSLDQQYLLHYTSELRGAGKTVNVVVTAGGSSTSVRYQVPALGAPAPAKATGLWASNGILAIVVALVAAFMLVAVYLSLRPVRVAPEKRLKPYLTDGKPVEEVAAVDLIRASEPMYRYGFMQRFAGDVKRGEVGTTPGRVVLIGVLGGTAAFLVIGLFTGQPLLALAGPPLGLLAAWFYVSRRAADWHAHFDATLADSLTVLASSLRAGHSLLQAIAHVAEEADERTAYEWRETVQRTQLGIAVEDALDEMVTRVGNRDLQWIALVARVQHQVGGNMAEMFDIVAETVRQRHRLRAAVHTLTAQGRMTRWVLTIAPFAIGAMLYIMSPQYISGFFTDHIGQLLMLMAIVLICIGSLWLKKIVDIEV